LFQQFSQSGKSGNLIQNMLSGHFFF